MNKIFFALAFMALASCSPSGENRNNAAAEDTMTTAVDTTSVSTKAADSVAGIQSDSTNTGTTDPIVMIRKKVEHINTASMEKKHTEFVCDEKMTVDRYHENGQVVKISVDFGTVGDVYAKEDYYYDNGKLIFKYEFVEGGPACEGCIKKNEYRSYIQDGKVIRYLKDKTQQKCRTCTFSASGKEYKLLKATTDEDIKKILCK